MHHLFRGCILEEARRSRFLSPWETARGGKIVFVQIAGLIARRIVCWVKEGDEVVAGQRFGLIRFGSRLDLYLPEGSRIIAKPNHKVRAGETILGYIS